MSIIYLLFILFGNSARQTQCVKIYIIDTDLQINGESPSNYHLKAQDSIKSQGNILNHLLSIVYENKFHRTRNSKYDRSFGGKYLKKILERNNVYDIDGARITVPPQYIKYLNTKGLIKFNDLPKNDPAHSELRSINNKGKKHYNNIDPSFWYYLNPSLRNTDSAAPDIWNNNKIRDYYDYIDLNINRLANSYRKNGKQSLRYKEFNSDIDISEEKPKNRRRPKRFKIMPVKNYQTESSDDTASEIDSNEGPLNTIDSSEASQSVSLSVEERKKKPSAPIDKLHDQYAYIQGRNRLFGTDGRRKRMTYFMPKRYHWDNEDLPNLGYYWFNGPLGKYPAPYRID